MLTRDELLLAAELLKRAADDFGNHVCNDYTLPETPGNYTLLAACERWAGMDRGGEGPHVQQGKIVTMDWLLMEWLASRLREEAGDG